MKKKTMAFFVAIVLVLGTPVTAFASENQERASHYLDDYYVMFFAKGNGKMAVSVSVNGVDVEDVIGILEIYIEQKVDGKWHYYDTLDSAEFPEFLEHNTETYLNTIYFQGTPGVTYRVTINAYAQKGDGWDDGYVTSYAAVCE